MCMQDRCNVHRNFMEEWMNEHSGRVSRKRRHFLAAGAAVPLGAVGFSERAAAGLADNGAEAMRVEEFVVSGRLIDEDRKPLSDRRIELSAAHLEDRVVAMTDGDGRFVARSRIAISALGRPGAFTYRVLDEPPGRGTGQVALRPDRGRSADAATYRDEQGIWRATFAAQVA